MKHVRATDGGAAAEKGRMVIKKTKIIIAGVTESGEPFRPSDWAERMSGALSTFHKHRMHYSPMLQPSIRDGHRCIVLDPSLAEANPDLYHSVMQFAKVNQLRVSNEDIEVETESDRGPIEQ